MDRIKLLPSANKKMLEYDINEWYEELDAEGTIINIKQIKHIHTELDDFVIIVYDISSIFNDLNLNEE